MANEGIQVEIYKDTNPTEIVDILDGRISPTFLSEIRNHGAGSFKISRHDHKILADPSLIDYRNIFKFRVDGKIVGGCILQTRKSAHISEGEKSQEVWEISGEGLRAWSKDATVHPALGLKRSSADTRFFNFSTEQGSWYNAAEWNVPYNIHQVRANAPWWGTAPAEWPDVPQAFWVWGAPMNTGANGSGQPLGLNYFRYEFTASDAATTPYALFLAIDDLGEVYVDGELKVSITGTSWQETVRVDLELEQGPHVIGIKAENRNSGSPGAVVAALFKYGDPNIPTSATLIGYTGQNTWRVLPYPSAEPGWSPGDVLLTLLNEAEARGVRFAANITPTFTQELDSSGNIWPAPIPWSFGIGTTYSEVIESLEELSCDIYLDPDTLQLHAWIKRGTDRSLEGPVIIQWQSARENLAKRPVGSPSEISWSRHTALGSTSSPGGLPSGVPDSFAGVRNLTGATAIYALRGNGNRLELSSSQVYTISAYVYSSDQSSTGVFRISPLDGTAIESSATFGFNSGEAGSWKRVQTTFTPSATGEYSVAFVESSTPVGAVLAMSGIQAEEGNVATSFFYGGTTDTSTVRYDYSASHTSEEEVALETEPLVFEKGKNLLSAEETGQADIANNVLLQTSEGWVLRAPSDNTSITKYGVVETQMSTQLSITGSDSLTEELFRQKAAPEKSATFVIFPTENYTPFENYDVGDWVSAPGEIVQETRRIMSLSFAEDENTGRPTYSVEFDTIFKDRQTELERWVSRASNAGGMGSGFSNSGPLPPTTVIVNPPGNALHPVPDAPTGFTISSSGRTSPDGKGVSDFLLSWNPVTTASSFGLVDVESYEVWGRKKSHPDDNTETPQRISTVFDSLAFLKDYTPGDYWAFKVRAMSSAGMPGYFSPELTIQAQTPALALAPPTAPYLQTKLGIVVASWGGLLGTDPPPPGFWHVYAEVSWDGGTTWENIAGQQLSRAGDITFVADRGTEVWVRFRAVDLFGRTTSPGSAASITVLGATGDDFEDESIPGVKLVTGSIEANHLSPSVGSTLNLESNGLVNIIIASQANQSNLLAQQQNNLTALESGVLSSSAAAEAAQASVDAIQGDIEDIATSVDETNSTVSQMATYYRFGAEGALIGKTDDPFELALRNDRIEIRENGVVVSYWDSGQMIVPSFVGDEVVLANHKLEKYGSGTVVRKV